MHKDRMAHINKWAIPPEGTPERQKVNAYFSQFQDDPKVKEYTKKTFEEAVANVILQQENGSGLPADNLLREYNGEYNNRVFNYSLRQMPSSFNIVESFNTFLPKTATFELNKEIDHVFSFGDFLDYVTSEELPDIEDCFNDIDDGTIYSFNSTDDLNDYLFSSGEGDEYCVLSTSFIKHKNELSIVILSGMKCDLEKKTAEIIENTKPETMIRLNNTEPDDDLPVEATPLIKGYDFWKTVILVRIDLNDSKIDSRYIFQDIGNAFTGITDDVDAFLDNQGNFISDNFPEFLKNNEEKILKLDALFELSKTFVFLPSFKKEYEDVISVERHPTEYLGNRKKTSYRKTNKNGSHKHKLAYRNIEKITPQNRNQPITREVLTPDFQIQNSGYWKKLDYRSVGEDKNNQPIQGRTWVNKTLAWKESRHGQSVLNIKTPQKKNGAEHGFIYVMRSAIHEKNVFKVGLTERDSDIRSNELSRSTSSPDHFHVMQEWEVSDCKKAEKQIHDELQQYRINMKREYFKAPYKTIFAAIDKIIDKIDGDS